MGRAEERLPLGAMEFHVLLALLGGARYGYAVMKAVEVESGGRVAPQIGSLYRLLTRLMGEGLVEETTAPRGGEGPHPGRDRRYYRLTALGRATVKAEANRLREVVALATSRTVLPDRSAP
ncbi:MAG: PadR family transcriptional regulator [Gemmatimonadetes bacterium]|nr:PadR family transcriptional regulator [Gemmatimonadota bacterium]